MTTSDHNSWTDNQAQMHDAWLKSSRKKLLAQESQAVKEDYHGRAFGNILKETLVQAALDPISLLDPSSIPEERRRPVPISSKLPNLSEAERAHQILLDAAREEMADRNPSSYLCADMDSKDQKLMQEFSQQMLGDDGLMPSPSKTLELDATPRPSPTKRLDSCVTAIDMHARVPGIHPAREWGRDRGKETAEEVATALAAPPAPASPGGHAYVGAPKPSVALAAVDINAGSISQGSLAAMQDGVKPWSETNAFEEAGGRELVLMESEAIARAEGLKREALTIKRSTDAQRQDMERKAYLHVLQGQQLQQEHKEMQVKAARRLFEQQKRMEAEAEKVKASIAAEFEAKERELEKREAELQRTLKQKEEALLLETREIQSKMVEDMEERTRAAVQRVLAEERQRSAELVDTEREKSNQALQQARAEMAEQEKRMIEQEKEFKIAAIETKIYSAVEAIENKVQLGSVVQKQRGAPGTMQALLDPFVGSVTGTSNQEQNDEMMKQVRRLTKAKADLERGKELQDQLSKDMRGEGFRARGTASALKKSAFTWAGAPTGETREDVALTVLDEARNGAGPPSLTPYQSIMSFSVYSFKLFLVISILIGVIYMNIPEEETPSEMWQGANEHMPELVSEVPLLPCDKRAVLPDGTVVGNCGN